MWSIPLSLSVSLLHACGGNDEGKTANCSVGADSGCESGQVCEEVEGGTPACFSPVILRGRVIDVAEDRGVQGATVAARDVNGSVVSRGVAITAADGTYSLSVPALRDASGRPTLGEASLRADAAGYATFPSGLRVALPIDVTVPKEGEGGWIVENDSTDVGLDRLLDSSGLGTVRGKINVQEPAGTLIVSESASAIVSTDGTFTLFNVPAGTREIRGYKAGLQLTPVNAEVPAGKIVSGIELVANTSALATVTGDVTFVNAGTQQTSVVLVVASTFNEALARGEVPIGLRQFPVSGRYVFEGVPQGDYVVLAAFENDGLVRDPDTSIGGTAIQRITVGSAEVAVTSFKITGALEVMAPGAQGPESVSGAPTFVWQDDSSEDGYEVVVYDTFGKELWRDTDVARVTGSPTASLSYSGPSLAAGYYQFRAVSFRDEKGGSGARTYISATEDLKGVFIVR